MVHRLQDYGNKWDQTFKASYKKLGLLRLSSTSRKKTGW